MQVFINTPSSPTFSLTVDPADTVRSLKDKIIEEKKASIPKLFTLQSCSKPLREDVPLVDYNLQEGSTLFLTCPLLGGSSPQKAVALNRKPTISHTESDSRELHEKIEKIKKELNEAIIEPFHEMEKLEVTKGEITLLELSHMKDVVMAVTASGQMIDYNYVTKKVIGVTDVKQQVTSLKRAAQAGILAMGFRQGKARVIHYDNNHQIFEDSKFIEITPDGRYIFCKSGHNVEGHSIRPVPEKRLYFYGNDVGAFTLSSDGERLYVGGVDNIKVYSVETCALLETIPDCNNSSTTKLIVSANDRFLISVRSNRSINIMNLNNKTNKIFRHIHTEEITSVKVTFDSKFLFSGSADGSLVIYDLEKLMTIYKAKKFQQDGVKALVVTNDGRKLMSAGGDGNITVYEINSGEGMQNYDSSFECLTNIGSGHHYAVGCRSGEIKIYNVSTGHVSVSIDSRYNGSVTAIAGSADAKWIAAAFEDRSLCIFNSGTGELYQKFSNAHPDAVEDLVFTTDMRHIITCSSDLNLKVWEIKISGHSNNPIAEYQTEHTDPIRCMTISKDGTILLTSSWDHSISVLSLANENLGGTFSKFAITRIHRFKDAHDGPVNKVAISKNNKLILSVGSDLTTKIHDLERRDHYHTFKGFQTLPSRFVDFALNDQCIATITEEGTFNLFSIVTKNLIYSTSILTSGRTAGAIIVPDNDTIVAASSNGQIRVMPNPFLSKPISINCGSLPVTSNFGFCLLSNFLSDKFQKKRSIEIIKQYPDLYIHPYRWNFLHIVSIFAPDIELIDACIDAKIPIILDNNGLTPVHYLIHTNNHDVTVFNYFLARFGDLIQDEKDQYAIMASLSNYLPAIIKAGSFQAANFLNYAVMKPQVYANNHRAIFGSLDHHSYKFAFSDSTVMTPALRDTFSKGGDDQMLSVKVLAFNYNYAPTSRDMLKLMMFLEELDDPEIYKTASITMIVDYLWKQNRSFFYKSALLYSAVLLLVSVYSGLGVDYRSHQVEIAILVLGGLLLGYEIILLILEGVSYLKDIWNYVDIAVHLLLIAFPITVWSTGRSSVPSQSLLTALLLCGYIRWLSYFNVIDQTRRLIKTIEEVLKDMASFFMILVFMTFGFTLIFVQYTMTSNNTNFGTELYNTYNLYFGNVNETYTAPQMIYFFIFTVFVSIVMLNLLIALINETFGRVSDSQEFYENQAKVSMIIEAIVTRRFTKKLTAPFRRFTPRNLIRAYYARSEGEYGTYLTRFLQKPTHKAGHLYIAKSVSKEDYEELMEERQKLTPGAKSNEAKEDQAKFDAESLRSDIRRILREELKIMSIGAAVGGVDGMTGRMDHGVNKALISGLAGPIFEKVDALSRGMLDDSAQKPKMRVFRRLDNDE